ncbi:MAG: hypothetical protein ACE5JX_23170 [Acidobacteriota bacterium]
MTVLSGKLITAGLIISICVGASTTPVVFAQRRGRSVQMEGLITRVNERSREIRLWEFRRRRRRGEFTWTLQVPGTTNMRGLQVGELVRVRTDGSRRLALDIRKLPPPEGDKAYDEAVRRLEAETGAKVE